jgi:hypothetical protein
LNDLIYGTSFALCLPRFVVVRVAGAHLAIGQFVVVDGGHALVGQELTNRTTNATVLSWFRLVLPFDTNFAFQCFVFVRKRSCVARKAGGVGRTFGTVVAVYRARFTVGTFNLLDHVGISTRIALGTKRLATRKLIPSSHTLFATVFFRCRNVFPKCARWAKILGAFETPSARVTFNFKSTVAQVPCFAFITRVGGCVDVLRHVATQDTTTFVDVVFDERT